MTREEIQRVLDQGHPIERLPDGRWILARAEPDDPLILVPEDCLQENNRGGVWILRDVLNKNAEYEK